jgi:hypothetical protein
VPVRRGFARRGRGCVVVNLGVEGEINPRFNPCADDGPLPSEDHGGMTATDYLINAVFVFVVLDAGRGAVGRDECPRALDLRRVGGRGERGAVRQARERQLDVRSLVVR